LAQSQINTKQFFVREQSNWIEKIEYSKEAEYNTLDIKDGAIHLLVDYQANVQTREKYFRYVIKIVNNAGAENYADLWINFDPGYQELAFHSIVIHRNGKQINRLEKSKFKIIQNESELDSKILNGTFSAGYFIEDVQVGDIIEYSYTIKGDNPIFGNNFFDSFSLQFNAQIKKVHRSVRYPKSLNLYYKLFYTDTKPQQLDYADYTIIKWELEDIPEIVVNSQLPSWYSPYPRVQVSTFNSWNQLIEWGSKYYPKDITLDAALNAEFIKITGGHDSIEAKINALIQFVKDEIRYVGMEIDEYSHKPRNPNEVFSKRFGDCKEKSFLLSTLLQKLGVTSNVAYVNTYLKHRIVEYLPSPTIFNHAIVAIEHNGKTYFVDPTMSSQKGNFTEFYNGELCNALIISSKYNEPVAIVQNNNEKITITETYDIVDVKTPVKNTVESKYYGSEADRMRSTLKSTSRKELENSFLNFYSANHPNMKLLEELSFNDDERNNCIEVIEKYEIDDFWVFDSVTNKDYVCNIDATNLKYYITVPEQRNRKHPFGIYYPITIENRITFNHAKNLNIKPEIGNLKNANFDFKHSVIRNSNSSFTLDYTFMSLKDYVDTNEMTTYLKDYNNIRDVTYYSLTWGSESTTGANINWFLLVISIVFCAILFYIAKTLYPKDLSVDVSVNALQVGGWLIIPTIGLFLSPFMLGYHIYTSDFFDLSSWQYISSIESAGYDPYWMVAFILELFINLLFIIYSLFLILLLVNRRTTFPRHYIILRVLNLLLVFADFILVSQIDNPNFTSSSSSVTELSKAIFGAAIWIPYMLYSERVKNTFVRSYNEQQFNIFKLKNIIAK
jgi:hypothetical protein